MKYRPEYDLKVIGENLKRLREEKQLSVKYVKEYLRLGSVQAIYKYESGKGYPQADTMLALMELYGADIKDIIHKHKENLSCFNEYIRAYYIDKINSCIDLENNVVNIEGIQQALATSGLDPFTLASLEITLQLD